MKKIGILVVTILILSFSFSEAKLALGIKGGLAFPNDNVADAYNKTKQDFENGGLANIAREGAATGYQIGIETRYPTGDFLSFYGGVALTRFPESDIDLVDPESGEVLASFKSVQNIVPVSAGLKIYPINTIVAVYGLAEINYNFISNTVDYKSGDATIPFAGEPKDSRAGFSAGVGSDFDLALITANAELKYNFANLIGREDTEDSKNYLTFTVGVYFGKAKP